MIQKPKSPVFISVDVETTGSQAGLHSMYQIGACLVSDVIRTFTARLVPISRHYEMAALTAVGMRLDEVMELGEPASVVMRRFHDWVRHTPGGPDKVFVGFNAAFDWKFVDWYFLHYVGENPFGFAPLDIKALVMGALGCDWFDTKMSRLPPEVRPDRPLTHDGLDDAVQQAEIFRKTLELIRQD